MMSRASILLITVFSVVALVFSSGAFAEEKKSNSSDSSQAEKRTEKKVVIEEKEPLLPRILHAPLALPRMVVRGIGRPLKLFLDYSERVDLTQHTIEFFSNEARTFYWYPAMKFGGAGGVFLGMGAVHKNVFNRKYRVSALSLFTPALDQEASFSFSGIKFHQNEISTRLAATWVRRQDEDYFGLGNSTPGDSRSYEARYLNVKVPVSGKLSKQFRWMVFGQYVGTKTQDSTDPSDALVPRFAPNEIVGLGEWINGGEFGLGIGLDTTDSIPAPSSGTRINLAFSRYEAEDDFGFFRTVFSLSEFFSPFGKGRVFALGARIESANTVGNDRIPFQLLPTLGGANILRGFDRFRFRDRASVLFIGEYRYPVWRWIDGMLFVDVGRVADHVKDLSIDGFKPAGGFGFRFRTSEVFFFQLQMAVSDDNVQAAFSVNQTL